MIQKLQNLMPSFANSPILLKGIKSVIIIFIFWILTKILHKIIKNSSMENASKFRWKKIVTYSSVLITFFLVGRIWYEGVQALATFFGLFSAGLAIALKELIANIAGWLFILFRKPFIVTDRIQIGDFAGDVIDQDIFQFTILEIRNWVDADQTTGRIIHIPNGKIFTQNLVNYTQGFNYIWNEIGVLITFESNWKKAKTILNKIVNNFPDKISKQIQNQIKKASEKFLLNNIDLSPQVYTDVKDSGVLLTVRYLCEPNKRRKTAQDIWEAILTEFAKADDIDLAYPTYRVFNNRFEGKVK
jgi:small-conductance mechanosensitive channel